MKQSSNKWNYTNKFTVLYEAFFPFLQHGSTVQQSFYILVFETLSTETVCMHL